MPETVWTSKTVEGRTEGDSSISIAVCVEEEVVICYERKKVADCEHLHVLLSPTMHNCVKMTKSDTGLYSSKRDLIHKQFHERKARQPYSSHRHTAWTGKNSTRHRHR